MNTKRRGFIAGGVLAGALLLGTAGLVAAQDPSAIPAVMGSQGDTAMMTPELFEQMDAIHDQMVASGGANYAQMDAIHAQHHPTR